MKAYSQDSAGLFPCRGGQKGGVCPSWDRRRNMIIQYHTFAVGRLQSKIGDMRGDFRAILLA